MTLRNTTCAAAAFLFGSVAWAQNTAPTTLTFEHDIQPFLAKNCYMCHNAKLKTAGVDLSAFKTDASADAAPELWEKVQDKLRQGAMPPPGLPQPKQAAKDDVLKWLEAELARADANAKPDPGHITAHRLNRVEYDNTVRDLLGVDIHPADEFPQDDSGYGFDNIGDVLSISPVLMERYMNAADHLVHAALYGPEKTKPLVVRHQPTSRKFPLLDKALTDYDVTGLSMPNALHATHRFAVEGDYTFRIALEGRRPNGSEPVYVGVWLDGKQVGTVTVDAPSDGASIDLFGMQREIKLHMPAGEHWIAASILKIYEGLPVEYGGPNPSHRPFTPPKNGFKMKGHVPANRVYVHYVEVVGPYNPKLGPDPAARKLIFVCNHKDGHHNSNCPKLILARFTRRAFRRAVSPQDIQPYLDLFNKAQAQGMTFDDSIGFALQAVLVSPDFLFRIDNADPERNLRKVSYSGPNSENAVPVSDFALASRLSYFLWSTMPDEQLLNEAQHNRLHQPKVLRAEVQRMLRDPRSHALAENFAGQWLELRKLESVHPDHERFPQWDDYLRMSMQKETEMFFEDVVRNDRSILTFLDGKTTFLNEKLANFYGMPGIKGTDFRPVSLEGTHRAGILTQASVMTVSSYATRTSPVLRGKWVLENFLNATIPPPPPNVPRFDENKVGLDATMRMQLEEHRKNPMCAACHTKMDPIGFAFENYNAIGQWRDLDGKYPVDARGKLPSGETFTGALELEQIYRKNPNAFAECVTVKLMTYALGRGIERYDRPTVKQIVKNISEDDYRFSDLVLEIVNSLPFENTSRGGDRT